VHLAARDRTRMSSMCTYQCAHYTFVRVYIMEPLKRWGQLARAMSVYVCIRCRDWCSNRLHTNCGQASVAGGSLILKTATA